MKTELSSQEKLAALETLMDSTSKTWAASGHRFQGIDLSRVLWWLQNKTEYHVGINRVSEIILCPKMGDKKNYFQYIYWDTSKSLLRDQSPEVWEFLYDLLIAQK